MIVDNHASLFERFKKIYICVSIGQILKADPCRLLHRASEKRRNMRATIHRDYAITRIEKL